MYDSCLFQSKSGSGAYVFITGRRKDKLDEAVKLIGKKRHWCQSDAANLADLDRLYDSVKREKGKIDILFASAGRGELVKLDEVTEEHFDKTFDLNFRGTLFTVQKALPLFNDNGSIFMNGSIASIKGFPGLRRLQRQQGCGALLRPHLAVRAQRTQFE